MVMPSVGVDFDGVIHCYGKGWQDGSIYDVPVEGAFDALRELMAAYSVFIFTTRTPVAAVAGWITAQSGIPCTTEGGETGFWNTRGTVLVTGRKLAAVAYIDDRGIRFRSWPQALGDLSAYEAEYWTRPAAEAEAAPGHMKRFVCYRPRPPQEYTAKGLANPPGEPQFEGVVFSDGTCSVRWLTAQASHSVWGSWADLDRVHGHPEYGTVIKWLDGEP